MHNLVWLSILQGVTEFLPVSSSGHLYIVGRYLQLNGNYLAFFILLHIATLAAIYLFFGKKIILDLFKKQILLPVAVITVITAICGLGIDLFLKQFFTSKYVVSFFLLINSGILLSAVKLPESRDNKTLTIKDAVALGFVQGLAVFPGISRSGITIIALLKRGFNPEQAFRLSFLMAIPAILGAFLLEGKNLALLVIPYWQMAIAFIIAAASGLLALLILKRILVINKIYWLGYYCIIISLLTILR